VLTGQQNVDRLTGAVFLDVAKALDAMCVESDLYKLIEDAK
jgi:hypothetical protein